MKRNTFLSMIISLLLAVLILPGCQAPLTECIHVCEVCGACVNADSVEEVCIEKCKGHDNLSDTSTFTTSLDGKYRYGEIDLYSGTQTELYSVMYVPAELKTNYPTVVMAHGLNATADGMAIMAKELVQYGYACLTFDFVNGSNLSKSGNKMKKMTLLTEKEDLLAVMNQLRFIDYVDQNNVFLYSESQGGMVSVLVANEISDKINGLILSYPALMIPDTIRATYPDKNNIPDTISMGGCALGKVYAQDAYDLDAWALCEAYKDPVLIMHGTQDTSVDLSTSQKAITHFGNADLEIIEGAGHGFGLAEYRVPTMKMLSDFVQKNLSK